MNRLFFALALGLICTQAATAGAPVNSLSNGKTGNISFKSIPTISMNQFLAGTAGQKSTVISGSLILPKRFRLTSLTYRLLLAVLSHQARKTRLQGEIN